MRNEAQRYTMASPKMKHEKSFPNLRKKLSSSVNDPPPEPLQSSSTTPRPRRPAAPLIDKTRNRKTTVTAARPKPFCLPMSPGGPHDPRDAKGPRFMCLEQAQRIQKVEYRPPPKCTGPKYPTIMGVTPNRLKPKPKVAEVKKRENRRTRALKTLRNPDRMFLKWKGTKSYARMRMFRRLNGCLKVLQLSGTNQTGTMLADIPEQKPLEIEVCRFQSSSTCVQRADKAAN